jgi:uncharacterized protein YutE (UPF0331/DUF86 family)
MILKKEQKEDIARRIDFIQVQLSDLNKFAGLKWETYRDNRDTQRNIERLAENVANAAIDISKIIIAGDEMEMPNSYKEIILKLGEIKLLDEKLASEIADFAALRNILAHQYLDLKWEKIGQFIKKAPDSMAQFINAAKNKL